MVSNGEKSESGREKWSGMEFDSGEDWFRMSADIGRICETVGEQVRKAMEQVDWDAMREEINRATQQAAEEIRRSADEWPWVRGWWRPMHVHVDVRGTAEPGTRRARREEEGRASTEAPQAERMIILNMVAEGKITAEEGARLLEALGS